MGTSNDTPSPQGSGVVTELALTERTVAGFPGVRCAVARLVPDISGDVRPVVWLEADDDIDIRELRRFMLSSLPRAAVPSRIVPVAALPRMPDGTVDQDRLTAPSWISASVHSLRLLPDQIENQLLEEWLALLDRPDIEVDDDFFDLGGTSRDALRLLALCAERFGVDVPPGAFFARPTIEHLAVQLKASGAAHTCLLTVGSGGVKRPFYCVYPGTGLQGLRLLSRADADRPFVTITPHGFGVSAPQVGSLAELAAHYVAEIRQVQPRGPYHLGGHCASTIVAYEIADQLTRQGETVATFVGVKPTIRVDLERVDGTSFFVLDELFGSAVTGSAADRIAAMLDEEVTNLRSPDTQSAAIARMRPVLADLYTELMSTASMTADYGFDRFMALIESWAWYVTAAARHELGPVSFPIDIATCHPDTTALVADWQAVSGRTPSVRWIDNIEPFETPEFADWLTPLLDDRDRLLEEPDPVTPA